SCSTRGGGQLGPPAASRISFRFRVRADAPPPPSDAQRRRTPARPRRRALRDMGVLGSVSAMDGAIAAYTDVFTAVPKTPISRTARPRRLSPDPRADLGATSASPLQAPFQPFRCANYSR